MKATTLTHAILVAFALAIIPEIAAAQAPADPRTKGPSLSNRPDVGTQNPTDDGGEELGTVILDVNRRIGTFRDWLDQQAQASKLPPDFAQRVAKLAELRANAETSLSARAEYEATFSTLLVEFDGALEAFISGREETFRRIDEMESSLKEGKASMDAAASASTTAHGQHAQRAKDLLASLVDSGLRAKQIVDSGGTVPPEAQSAALEAESMKETSEFLAEIDQAKANQARSAADELADQLRELKELRALFQEDFTNAANGRMRASAIGGLRKQISDSSALLAQLEMLKKAHRNGRRAIDKTVFTPLTDLGPEQTRSTSTTPTRSADDRGLKLMLKYADHTNRKPTTQPIPTSRPAEVKNP